VPQFWPRVLFDLQVGEIKKDMGKGTIINIKLGSEGPEGPVGPPGPEGPIGPVCHSHLCHPPVVPPSLNDDALLVT
jgi:hypothetical protein